MVWAICLRGLLGFISIICLVNVNAQNTTVLHSDSQVTYGSLKGSDWARTTSYCGGEGYAYASAARTWIGLEFEGTAIQAHLIRGWSVGAVHIILDNVLQTPNDGQSLTDTNDVSATVCKLWVFEKSGLTEGKHNIAILQAGGGNIAFNKFIYTKAESSLSPSSPSSPSSPQATPVPTSNASTSSAPKCKSTAGIIGGVVGGLVVGLIIGWAVSKLLARRNLPPGAQDRLNEVLPLKGHKDQTVAGY